MHIIIFYEIYIRNLISYDCVYAPRDCCVCAHILLKYSSFRHEADVNRDTIRTHNGFQIYRNSFRPLDVSRARLPRDRLPRAPKLCGGLRLAAARVEFNPNASRMLHTHKSPHDFRRLINMSKSAECFPKYKPERGKNAYFTGFGWFPPPPASVFLLFFFLVFSLSHTHTHTRSSRSLPCTRVRSDGPTDKRRRAARTVYNKGYNLCEKRVHARSACVTVRSVAVESRAAPG